MRFVRLRAIPVLRRVTCEAPKPRFAKQPLRARLCSRAMAPRNGFAALAERARELQRSRHTFDFKQAQKREFRTVPRPRERPVGPGSDAEWCAYRRTSQRTNNGPDRRNDRATLLIQNRRTKLQMFTITATIIPGVSTRVHFFVWQGGVRAWPPPLPYASPPQPRRRTNMHMAGPAAALLRAIDHDQHLHTALAGVQQACNSGRKFEWGSRM